MHADLKVGYLDVVDADLRQYFETIPHAELMRCVARRISDGKVLALIKAWLQAPVIERDGRGRPHRSGGKHHHRGTPQGGVISPLLALLYMRRFLLAWQQWWEQRLQARVQVYADDLVILCRGTAVEALAAARDLMRRIKLELNEEKTRVVDARKENFDFLGYTFGPMYSRRNGWRYLGAAPSKARVRRLRQAVHRYLTPHNQSPMDEVIAHLNRLLVGWQNFFSYGTVTKTYRQVDRYVTDRLRRFLVRRHKINGRGTRQFPNRRLYQEYGLRPLTPSSVW